MLGIDITFRRAFSLLLALGGCATIPPPAPTVPSYRGLENDYWLALASETVGRRDILPAFRDSAQSYGCRTEHLYETSRHNIHGEMRGYRGINATCDEGTIALIALAGGRVSIGCAKPTNAAACDRLLKSISEAR